MRIAAADPLKRRTREGTALESHTTLIARLNDRIHECLKEVVSPEEPVAFLDFPDYTNCGDSAIWLGQMRWLRDRCGKRPAYVARLHEFSPEALDGAMPEGPVFITGGGNFGDLWGAHQDFREQVMELLPGRRIIQFPQSIHYRSPERAEQTARAIGKHGNFVLLVRDEASKEYSEKHFDCEVRLCPDMAFGMGPLEPGDAEFPVLAMLRNDKESALGGGGRTVPPDVPVEDWIGEPKLPVRLSKALGAASALIGGRRSELRLSSLDAAAHKRVRRGTRQLSRARAIVTDRLHVHIVSLLLGRPHAVLDNSYGKVQGFMNAFSGGSDLSYLAASLDDGIAWARERAARDAGE